MKQPTRRGWLLAALLIPLFSSAADVPVKVWTEIEWTQAVEKLRPGMSLDQVRDILGPPRRIARQILYQRYLEQWVYESPLLLRLEFDCRRGQRPVLQPFPARGTTP